MIGAAIAAAARGATLLAMCWAAVALEIAPVGAAVKPDILFCVVASWAVARPAATPIALVMAAGVARDMLTGAPPGAGALGLTLATLALRAHAPGLATRGAVTVYLAALAALAATVLIPAALMAVTLAPAPSVVDMLARLLLSALLLPVVALMARAPSLRDAEARTEFGAPR